MKVVIDCNRIIAALIKESTTRDIIFNKNFDFFAPNYILIEINKYKSFIIDKAKISEENFDILLSLIFQNIIVIPKNIYNKFIKKFKYKIKDQKDIPYLAAAFAIKADGIWTHDTDFKDQKEIQIFSNIDMLNLIRSNSQALNIFLT